MATILIIDDSKLARTQVRRQLTTAGHNTLEAENGRQGLEMALSEKPDCILLDLLMPEMNGIELLQALAANGVETPKIVVTANIQPSVRSQCLELGAADIINKPANRGEEFLRRIEDILRYWERAK